MSNCCSDCKQYWGCGCPKQCNRVRRKMCRYYEGDVRMFKNITILILAVLLLIVICNSTLDFSFTLPSRSKPVIKNPQIKQAEQKIMDAARIIEQLKDDEILREKVKGILEQLEN